MVSITRTRPREYELPEEDLDEGFDMTVPYISINGKNKGIPTAIPGIDADDVSYSPSTSERRGSGGKATMKVVAASFMKAMDRNYMDGTKDSIWRRYKRQDRDIDYLYRNGVLTTTSVKKMKPVDVHNLLMYRRSLNVSDAEMVHEMSALANIFKFVGNTAYEVALREYPQLKVSATHVRLPSLEPEECRAIIDKAATIKDGDWFNMVRYAVVVFAFCSGLRSKELRLCDVNCIRMKEGTWTVEVRHPKGEGKYGEVREAPIHPDAYPFLTRYFAARAQHVRETLSTTHALFLGSVCTDGYLATNTVRAYADYVSKDLDIDVDLRKCRRTYGQRLIDLKVPVSVVSVVMGHKSTRTTEQHYARVRAQTAIDDVSKTFENMASMEQEYTDSQLPKGFELRREAPGNGV